MVMYKSCSVCGKIHRVNSMCLAKRSFGGSNERKLRSTYSWTEKSKEIRERANHLCEVCRDQGELTYDGLEVHHITKLSEDESRLLDNYNLICLCGPHHTQADNNEIDKDYLLMLAQRREEQT